MARAPDAGRRDHGGRRRRLHAGRAPRRRRLQEARRSADPDAGADAGHPGRPRRAAVAAGRAARCWSASPPRPSDVVAHAHAPSCAQKRVDLIVANDVSRADAGFDVDDQRRDPRRRPTASEAVPLQSQDARWRARILDRVENRLLAARRRRRRAPVAHVATSWPTHLRFYAELGVDRRQPRSGRGARAPADRRRDAGSCPPTPGSTRSARPRLSARPFAARAGRRPRSRSRPTSARLHALQAARARAHADRVRRRQSRAPT